MACLREEVHNTGASRRVVRSTGLGLLAVRTAQGRKPHVSGVGLWIHGTRPPGLKAGRRQAVLLAWGHYLVRHDPRGIFTSELVLCEEVHVGFSGHPCGSSMTVGTGVGARVGCGGCGGSNGVPCGGGLRNGKDSTIRKSVVQHHGRGRRLLGGNRVYLCEREREGETQCKAEHNFE